MDIKIILFLSLVITIIISWWLNIDNASAIALLMIIVGGFIYTVAAIIRYIKKQEQ